MNIGNMIIGLILTYSFHNEIRKYIENTLLVRILDLLCFVLILSLSLILDGNIFSLILMVMMTFFVIFIFYDMYRFKECKDSNDDVIIYPFILLSLYFYLNQYIKINHELTIRKLADCTYSSFAKTLMLLCIMLSLSYRSTDMFIFSSILLFYMLST